jgi:phosphatidylserine/phosphatidylglycerophosphate/cardiolipin synthase-like enzyme
MFSGCTMMSASWLDNDDDDDDCDEIPLSGVVTAQDDDVVNDLSHVGRAIYDCMRRKHPRYRGTLWNVTTGSVVGPFHQTPVHAFTCSTKEPETGHDDWFPQKMGEILSRTEYYADVMSLRPPDGLFLEEFTAALKTIEAKKLDRVVTIRMMFGNVIAWPVDCAAAILELTRGIVEQQHTTNIRLWVGAWRSQISWNHSKIIAVDGRYLHTGGHNMWSQHYLKVNPLHDVSVELFGRVAQDGHLFANQQWSFLEHGWQPWLHTKVSLATFPESAPNKYPPPYEKDLVPVYHNTTSTATIPQVPMLSIGKCSSLGGSARPSDDAILAMLESAVGSIRLAIQDFGPRCLPFSSVQIQYPGCPWPEKTLQVLARAIWTKRVQVEIVLSNRGAICGGLPSSDTLARPNGWTLQHVVDAIVQAVEDEFPESRDAIGCQKIRERLRVCGMRQRRGDTYDDGTKMGMHTKCFIVDDVASYIGSQNLYVCDLAEWGVVIDDKATTQNLLQEYWSPMWQCSYKKEL